MDHFLPVVDRSRSSIPGRALARPDLPAVPSLYPGDRGLQEVRAADAESALARLADIRKDEVTTERAFITGSVFSSLLTVILK